MATDTIDKTKSWVQNGPGICGGNACIRDTRITVWGLVQSRKLGASDARILENVVGLRPEDLQVAWDYYQLNSAEIDDAIRTNEEP